MDFVEKLAKLLRLTDEERFELEEALDDHVKKLVKDQLDREFNHGDYRRD